MNGQLSAKKTSDIVEVASTVLLFEADAYGPNASGCTEWFVERHGSQGAVVFCDIHSRLISRKQIVDQDLFNPAANRGIAIQRLDNVFATASGGLSACDFRT